MTVEANTPISRHIVAGTGPYAVAFPYLAGSVTVAIETATPDGTVRSVLDPADWSVSPAATGTTGTLTLTAPAAATHAGAQIVIGRQTQAEQGWAAVLGPREDSLGSQLDRQILIAQEQRLSVGGALRIEGALPPFVWTNGTVPILIDGMPQSGPSATQIAGAEGSASAAAASVVEIAALRDEVADLVAAAPVPQSRTISTTGPLTGGGALTGDLTIALPAPLVAINGTGNGLVARTDAGAAAARSIAGTTNQVTVTNGDGVAASPTIALTFPSQAVAEAGTDTVSPMNALRTKQAIAAQVPGVLNASGAAPLFGCRAWVNFNGTTTVPAIRAAGNVSSIVRNSGGNYTVNFATAMQDADYCVVVAHSGGFGQVIVDTAAGSFRVGCWNTSGNFADTSVVTGSVFR